MKITCPYCGARDIREFYYRGAAVLDRPEPDASAEEWDWFLHLRDNPAGETRELWHHRSGCGAWVVVQRDTRTHAVVRSLTARDAARGKA